MENIIGNILLITANVGTIFEHPNLLQGWFYEVLIPIQKFKPNIIAFSLQEIGGKDSASLGNLNLFCQYFYDEIINENEEDKFYTTGIIFNENILSPDFTALGIIILIRRSILDYTSIWDFKEQEFKSIFFCNSNQGLLSTVSDCKFVQHGRFKGTNSRKGYLKTKLKFGSKECDLVNIHLYHDEYNTIAISNIPSVYASERVKALDEMFNRCNINEQVPAFIFGDFNVRLDGDFMEWLKTQIDEDSLVIKEKDFFFKKIF